MNELNTTLNLYKFNDDSENLNLKILKEVALANEKGIEYFVVGDLSEKVTGFKRGAQMSTIITSLKYIKKTSSINVAIKNTFEDINFYKVILDKVPGIAFQFDLESAKKYSKNTIEEWNEFIGVYELVY